MIKTIYKNNAVATPTITAALEAIEEELFNNITNFIKEAFNTWYAGIVADLTFGENHEFHYVNPFLIEKIKISTKFEPTFDALDVYYTNCNGSEKLLFTVYLDGCDDEETALFRLVEGLNETLEDTEHCDVLAFNDILESHTFALEHDCNFKFNHSPKEIVDSIKLIEDFLVELHDYTLHYLDDAYGYHFCD